jgi:hypothetical protein
LVEAQQQRRGATRDPNFQVGVCEPARHTFGRHHRRPGKRRAQQGRDIGELQRDLWVKTGPTSSHDNPSGGAGHEHETANDDRRPFSVNRCARHRSACNICNWAQYSTSIMTNPHVRTTHLKDTIDVYNDIQNGSLPSVSFVKPSGFVDRHPASSKLDLFEGFVKKIITLVQANPKLWPDIAIFITFDEESGYWDSGYVQALDHFGDGTVFRCLWCRRTPPEGISRTPTATTFRFSSLSRRIGNSAHSHSVAATTCPTQSRNRLTRTFPSIPGDRRLDGLVQLRPLDRHHRAVSSTVPSRSSPLAAVSGSRPAPGFCRPQRKRRRGA